MKEVDVILSPEAEEVYNHLKDNKTILNAIKNKISIIKSQIHYGDPISKKLIPKEYIEKYDIKNLFRVALPNYWRMLYTLTNDDQKIKIIAFVLDIMNHENYNKKFNYRKR